MQRRVRCEFTKYLIKRAREKLQVEKKKGNIDVFRVFELRLNKIWNILRKSNEASDFKVGVTIGAGSPTLAGLSVSPATSSNILGRVSIDATSEVIRTWSPYFLKLE